MNRKFVAVTVLSVLAQTLFAASSSIARVDLILDTQSKLWLTGNSTLHPYSSTATMITVDAEIDPIGSRESAVLSGACADTIHDGKLAVLNVVVGTKSLKSGKEGLDKRMIEALKGDKYPEINFKLANYEIAASTASDQPSLVKASGGLAIAGERKDVVLEANIFCEGGLLRARGSKEILMTDYGVKPPTVMMGLLKTDNKVVVHFDLLFRLNMDQRIDKGGK